MVKIQADWLSACAVQTVLAMLNADGEQARIVGGAVRNHLMGMAVGDIDIATTCLPQTVIARAHAAGLKAVPTGVEHGTVTVIADHQGFEVTTLRADTQTDGRHAVVEFGRDWSVDASRRDFTINALYADADGTIFDPLGGFGDIEKRHVRFIGEASDRVAEDHLRILRFFRFFAWYGHGRPDGAGLRACVRARDELTSLSAERVWAEMRKLLAAPDPSRALLWMRQSGALSIVLPQSEKWGIDHIHGLIAAERAFEWQADAILRLLVIVPLRDDRLRDIAKQWKVANAVRDRMVAIAVSADVTADMDDKALARLLYRGDEMAIAERLKIMIARLWPDHESAAALAAKLDFLAAWERPVFPIKGKDLTELGVSSGPEMGSHLKAMEKAWVESDFSLSKDALIKARFPAK